MVNVTQTSVDCCLLWGDWELNFSWIKDRWTHLLQKSVPVGAGTTQSQLVSLEGTAEEAWPGSPAFQDLHLERISPDCCEVQLLGQAGKNHYSGAIRCDGSRNVIDFDLAVRIQTAPAAPLIVSPGKVSPCGTFHRKQSLDFRS
jgi:hypothetical protein